MARLTATKAHNAPLPEKGKNQTFIWCSEVKGFGVRTTANGVRSYVVQCRVNGALKRTTLGAVGVLAYEGTEENPGAVDLAKLALSGARRGKDVDSTLGKAAAQTFTLAQAWAAYADAGFPLQGSAAKYGKRKRESSIKADGYRWSKHVSKLADKPVASLNDATVQRWLDKIDTNGARNNALLLLLSTISFARSRNLCATPAITIKAGRSKCVQNYLTVEQLKAFDAACVELAALHPARAIGFHAARAIMHSGSRKMEMLTLRRDFTDLDAGTARLPIDKGSDEGRDVHLSPAAVAILRAVPQIAGNPFFFPGRKTGSHLTDIADHVNDALAHAKLKKVRVHDLRHSYASAAINAGQSLFMVGKLLGHRDYKSTLRYAHVEAAAQKAAAATVANLFA